MNRNFRVLLCGSIFFGLGLGIYEFALPYFLDSQGLSISKLGLIYAAGALLVFVVRIYAGDLSDRLGRRTLYGGAVLVNALVSVATPVAVIFWFQALLKSARDAAAMVFDSMHQLALHDDSRANYVARMGKTRGLQYLAESLATFGAGWLLAREAYRGSFHLSAALFAVGLLVFLVGYRPTRNRPQLNRQSLRTIFALDLPRPLVVLSVSAFVFTVGLATSHCFVMQLFWVRQFGTPRDTIGVLLMLHRLTLALPMLLVGWAVKKHLKQVYIVFVLLEGLALAVAGLIPSFLPAAVVWLTHDLFGAGIWIPIQSALIQKHARDESRGRDVSKVFALGSLGWVAGPLLAAVVFDHWYGGPFVLSGLICMLSAVILFALKDDD